MERKGDDGNWQLEVSADAPKKKRNLEDCTTGPCGTEDVWERAHSLEVNETRLRRRLKHAYANANFRWRPLALIHCWPHSTVIGKTALATTAKRTELKATESPRNALK